MHSLELSAEEAPFADRGDVDGSVAQGTVEVIPASAEVKAEVIARAHPVL